MLSGLSDNWRAVPGGVSPWSALRVTGASLLMLAFLTAVLVAVHNIVDVGTVMIVYLIAVLFAAIRGGVAPAVVSAVAAIGAAAFFFYPPIYDFRVHNPVHVIDLMLFIVVAAAIGKLATDARRARMRKEADALREALIGSVSHELRTPLASIVGSASVLAQSADVVRNPSLATLVLGLQEEADRLNDSIQNLLDATRISNEGVRPHIEWVDPEDVVNAAIERKRRLLATHQVKVLVADNLPLLRLDPMLLEKALGQLIENAVKYSPPSTPIEIEAARQNGMVRIAVRDQGSGMTGEEQGRIFERFYRSPRLKESIQGSGLGLWIARALVAACEGRIDAFSAGAGRGATVSLHVPVPRAAAFAGQPDD